MKDIQAAWFVQHPIDKEYKEYLLLDFLQSVNLDIQKNNIYYPIKKIFLLIKEFSQIKKFIQGKKVSGISNIITYMDNIEYTEKEEADLLSIIGASMGVLYRYAELGIKLWKDSEERIKTFDLFEIGKSNESLDFGILIFRNMATDEILPYLWQNGKIGTNSRGTIMRAIKITNPRYSMSYEFIANEILSSLKIESNTRPRITVMEILEDFQKDSVIIKIAKELFINDLTPEKTKG